MPQINITGPQTGQPVENTGAPPNKLTAAIQAANNRPETWFSKLQATRATESRFSQIVHKWEQDTMKAEQKLAKLRLDSVKAETIAEQRLTAMRRRETERQERRFDRDYTAGYRENARRDYTAMRYNADQDNRLITAERKARAAAEAAAMSRPTFGLSVANGAANHPHRGISLLGQMTRGYLRGGATAEGSGLGDVLGSGLGILGIAAAAVGLGAYETLKIPGYIANESDKDMSAASLYMRMRSQSADYGRMGGFDGGNLMSMIYGRAALPMMARFGYSPQDVFDISNQFGQRGYDSGTMANIAAATGQANLSRDLGGLGPQWYASALGQYATLNRSFAGSPMGSITAGGVSTQSPAFSSTNAYFSKLQEVMQSATAYGLDHSSVGNTLQNMLQARADNGAANLSIGDSANLWNRLSSGGLPSMRDGTGPLAFSSALDQSFQQAGFGGSTMQTMAIARWASRGGVPKTMAQLGRRFGFDYNSLPQTGRAIADQAMQALQAGNMLDFSTAISHITGSGTEAAIDLSYVKQFHLTPVEASQAYGALTGAGYSGAMAYMFPGSTSLPAASGLYGNGPQIPGKTLTALQWASQSTGVPLLDLEALSLNESSGGTNYGKGQGGLLQVTYGTFLDMQSKGLIPKSLKYSDLDNPLIGAKVGATYYDQMLQMSGGSASLAASHYNAGPGGLSPTYARKFNDNLALLTGNDADAMNNLSQQNALIAQNGQYDMRASNGGYDRLSAIFSGSTGELIQSADNAAGKFQDSSTAFAGSVKEFVGAVTRMVAQGMAGGGGGIHGLYGRHVPGSLQP